METIPVTPSPDEITFALLLTAAGSAVAAAIVTTFVSLLRAVFSGLPLNGAQLAFIASAVLFVLAGIAIGVDELDEGLVVFVAWLGCAHAAVGLHQTVTQGALSRPPSQ